MFGIVMLIMPREVLGTTPLRHDGTLGHQASGFGSTTFCASNSDYWRNVVFMTSLIWKHRWQVNEVLSFPWVESYPTLLIPLAKARSLANLQIVRDHDILFNRTLHTHTTYPPSSRDRPFINLFIMMRTVTVLCVLALLVCTSPAPASASMVLEGGDVKVQVCVAKTTRWHSVTRKPVARQVRWWCRLHTTNGDRPRCRLRVALWGSL